MTDVTIEIQQRASSADIVRGDFVVDEITNSLYYVIDADTDEKRVQVFPLSYRGTPFFTIKAMLMPVRRVRIEVEL